MTEQHLAKIASSDSSPMICGPRRSQYSERGSSNCALGCGCLALGLYSLAGHGGSFGLSIASHGLGRSLNAWQATAWGSQW